MPNQKKPNPVVITKPWSSTSSQYMDHGDDRYSIAELIADAKDLTIMDIPIQHMSMNQNIGGMLIREFVGHMMMVMDADLDHPVILDQDGDLFDGRHRLAKAIFDKVSTIRAVRFVENPKPLALKESTT